jgi:hypothetical protein
MKKLLLIAAAALLAAAWTVSVQLYENSSSGWRGNPQPLPIVATLDTNHNGISPSRASHEAAGALSFTSFQRCRRHIDKNFQRLTSVRQIAMECHLTVGHLGRLFQLYGHQSPYK